LALMTREDNDGSNKQNQIKNRRSFSGLKT
jgi:hypothetical protein